MSSPPPSVSSIELDCPIWLDRLVAALLDALPRNRPHTARAVVYALEEISKVDRNLTSVVDQMTSGFNPLTAGADKTEARRLLGQIVDEPESVPIYQRFWFQAVMLLSLLAIIVYGAWPPSNQVLLARGKRLAESDQIDQLSRAEDYFQRIVERRGADEATHLAEDLLQSTRSKVLWLRVQSGYVGLEPKTRMFADAYLAEINGDLETARLKYANVVRSAKDEPGLRHFVIEADKRIAAIDAKLAKKSSKKPVATPEEASGERP